MSFPSTRRLYIDWLRGVAVLIMILWHSIDAWTVQTGRDTVAFGVIIFFAGWAAPLFLFLAGVAVSLSAAARMRRGLTRREAAWALQKRGWVVFLLAHVFRFQSFLLNPNGTWSSLLTPDILNILGLGIVASAHCWGRAATPRSRAAWLLLPVVVIVVILAPWSRDWWWPTLLHPRLEAYIRPVGDYGVFTLFPAIAHVLAGALLGALIAEHDPRDAVFHRRVGIAGALLLIVGAIGAQLPTPAISAPADSARVFLWQTGVMTLAVSVAWALRRRGSPTAWSPLVVFGQTSLFVYWVHVELAYGVFSYPLRHALTLPWSLLAYLLLTIFMLGCAELWRRRGRGRPLIPEHMVAA